MSKASDRVYALLGFSKSSIDGADSEEHDTCAGFSRYTFADGSILIQRHSDGNLAVDPEHEPPVRTVADELSRRKHASNRPVDVQFLELDDSSLKTETKFRGIRVPIWLWERINQIARRRNSDASKVMLALTLRGLRSIESESASEEDLVETS